ncbi:alpha-amylase [Sporosarcina sp. Marseille-Q4063]|uniref:alpha-amylase family glycosyl hydrolase n=1 Tax=Sporosarcina sp. Marseille-Q4063 TaxID=2810514 RepID=UPI001BAE5754|nr:alpha-amylase family glycosyl hydrolase [Sporosarcina sp. Marseille-Q4063]QUW21661.1 alpha-amylase [Sporosarcina sp. Marseille-Q4063]
MKSNRWFGLLLSMTLILSIIYPTGVFAKNDRTLQDESIYDLLVDRFNDGNYDNNEGVDPRDMNAFSGGDFAGITDKLDYIVQMGFTLVSIGPVFSTATYDGNEVLDYEKLEPYFGTDEEFTNMIDSLKKEKIGVVADFPLSEVSENHTWVKNDLVPTIPAGDGTVNWDSSNPATKEMIIDAVVSFVDKYKLAGIRLTKLGDFDEDFLNEVIAEIKKADDTIYVMSTEESAANFDTVPNIEKMEALKQSYVQVNPDSSPLQLFEDNKGTELIQFDELTGPRFTYEMFSLRMFPPTRWKIAATALFTLPGVPVVPYGSEIAVNGKEAPESHPISNFKTDMELQEYIGDLNSLRNKSDTIRNGDFEMLHNKDGFTIFKRSSDEETWIVALNNTSKTENFVIDEDVIGENKRMRGVVGGDMIKQSKDGKYRVVLERELAEVYIVDKDKGFNTPYLIASILVYVLFLGFLWSVWRRGKKNKAEELE